MAALASADWQWENATAGAAAGLATVTFSHSLDVVRTRFQVYDGRISNVPAYRNTPHALFAIARSEGFRGIYAGFYPAVLGSTISWGLYFFFSLPIRRRLLSVSPLFSSCGFLLLASYSKAKQRYLRNREELSPGLHLASAAEAGALVSFCTNPIWLVKTRLQLQTPNQIRPYNGFHDALRTIIKEEGWKALYKGLMPGLFLVRITFSLILAHNLILANLMLKCHPSFVNRAGLLLLQQVTHGAIQFTAYEEFRKILVSLKAQENENPLATAADLLDSVDYATLGASSKLAAILTTYPFQQRPSTTGVPRYMDSWHVVKETARFEGLRGFYRGITPNMLKNIPAASISFIVYENVLNLLKLSRREY
ncbi:Folate transporter 1, chloroplastic [Capsicum annuum]|nr:Folate transporter 1, chloroplastic [Capsicum annuum]